MKLPAVPFVLIVALALALGAPSLAAAAAGASAAADPAAQETTTTTSVTRTKTTSGDDAKASEQDKIAAAKDKAEAKAEAAAKRRAATSEFEREPLDQDAFADSDKAAKGGDTSKESSSGSVMRAILGLVVVLGAIFGIHWLLKKWGASRLQGAAGSSGVIDVVATTTLAQGRAVHLLRVGEELVLVGATEQAITRLGDVDVNVLGPAMGNRGDGEFQAMLAGAMYASQPGVPAGMGGAGSAKQPFVKRFVENLRLSTAR